ncbi:MAG: LCP family protein [Solirubrobacteraceae bacterium]|nr:LCP family protein [Solirubrobacteraceae bacterium]
MPEENPRYRRYRGRPSSRTAPADDPLRELRDLRRTESGDPRAGGREGRQPRSAPTGPGNRQSLNPRRALRPPRSFTRRLWRWLGVWVVSWIVLSLLVFLVSAQLHQANVDGGDDLLGSGGTPPFGTTTILVIGSDKRPDGSKEPGASQQGGYGLADSIMLMRVGGGGVRKLSIARDTIVPIPGHGVGKINSAYAYGGPALLIRTIEGWTGINVGHTMQISFGDFPGLIDAMGGITYKGSCVIGKINGGYKNGGVTVRIPTGKRTHLNGDQALALARTRKNECNSRENDLTRAHRQQKVISAMKRRALSPIGFVRLPLIAWEAPKTMDSDMAGPRLIGTMLGLAIPGSGKTQVLGTESGQVPDSLKTKRVNAFLGN